MMIERGRTCRLDQFFVVTALAIDYCRGLQTLAEVYATTDYRWHFVVICLHQRWSDSTLPARLTAGFREQLTAFAAQHLPSQSVCSLEAVLLERASISYGSVRMCLLQQQSALDRGRVFRGQV